MSPAQPLRGARWDSFDAYLFDIDGTLIRCDDEVHYRAFCHALETIARQPLTMEGVVAHGNTDIGILRDAFALHKIEEVRWRERVPELRDSMCAYVARHCNELCPTVLPYVREVLHTLRSRGALLGVATGNLEGIGRVKLERAGLMEFFDFGAWSDAFEYRPDVVRSGVHKIQKLRADNVRICMVGDTPADVRAARENNIAAIAVATGIHSFDELAAERPDLCLPSFQTLNLAVGCSRREQVTTTSSN